MIDNKMGWKGTKNWNSVSEEKMMQEKQILAEARISSVHKTVKLTWYMKKKNVVWLQIDECYWNVYPHCSSLTSILKQD